MVIFGHGTLGTALLYTTWHDLRVSRSMSLYIPLSRISKSWQHQELLLYIVILVMTETDCYDRWTGPIMNADIA